METPTGVMTVVRLNITGRLFLSIDLSSTHLSLIDSQLLRVVVKLTPVKTKSFIPRMQRSSMSATLELYAHWTFEFCTQCPVIPLNRCDLTGSC
ncbi:hypothetical protein E2C01_021132 [Portunus trituberculatus]|uniref:Uncharacterized protein n=1 Tax=Portunus trituberculatus TaxID=210409 RepID=A0A5B7E1U5_PORTR|nr:hypothetical protein [Portunus trituberculatus]